jgi:hypothetical protein
MDRRDIHQESEYQKELKQKDVEYDDKIVENGKEYRIPYKMVKQVVFSEIRKEELRDLEHSARLQYRLLLQDSVLKAKVEFAKLRITIVFNPSDALNRKEKIDVEGLINFLSNEGVSVDRAHIETTDYDYYKQMYAYQFDPAVIREHPPYSYTKEQWAKMKDEWEKNSKEYEKTKVERFHKWQEDYLQKHPELAAELGVEIKPVKLSLKEKLLGKKAAKDDSKKEKGFWFHGV